MDNSGKRILIVDDTPENIQVLGAQLRKHDYLINVAQNGQQALDSVAKTPPDLILLDIMMPVLDGFETCKRLKANPQTADIPVIFLSARVETEDVIKGLDLGGVDYVTKPFNPAELMQRVRTHVTIRDLQTSLEKRVDQLNRAAKTIERMARENEAFLRHELNNAISPVLGYADLLVRKPDQDAEKRTVWAQRIKASVESIQGLFDSLRDLQAVERGTHEMTRKPVDLVSMIRNEVASCELAMEGKCTFSVEDTTSGSVVEIDADFMPGVFRNLLKNAAEHVMDIPSSEQGLSISMTDTHTDFTLTVSNGGSPIPPERLPTFFEKFNSSKVSKGGTGLGTSYAYVVVTAHGGDINVASDQEYGTKVTVTIPKKSN